MKPKFLVETALLTHGLPSASDSDIISALKDTDAVFTWIEKGKIHTGTIDEFIAVRNKASSFIRINHTLLEHAQKEGLCGILTASGTMAVCKKLDIPLAVTCGMGGIGKRENEQICHDADAFAATGVSLVATSPKDMFDIKETFKHLRNKGVTIYGNNTTVCTGYMFSVADEKITIIKESFNAPCLLNDNTLIINPIPEKSRISDTSILNKAILKGIEAEKRGGYYHPAVNSEIDHLTNGYSTKIQLTSLAENIKLAHTLAVK